MSWFGGKIKDNERFFPQFAADPKTTFRMYSEQKVSPETQAAYESEKTAAVVGVLLLQDMGWKVGDRITLLGTAYPVDVDLRIVGTYEGGDATWLWFRQDYLDELLGNPGIVGTFWLRVRSADDVAKVTEAVDAMFANSFSPTKTETETAFQARFISMMGNVTLFIGSICTVIVFTMLLVTASTMDPVQFG